MSVSPFFSNVSHSGQQVFSLVWQLASQPVLTCKQLSQPFQACQKVSLDPAFSSFSYSVSASFQYVNQLFSQVQHLSKSVNQLFMISITFSLSHYGWVFIMSASFSMSVTPFCKMSANFNMSASQYTSQSKSWASFYYVCQFQYVSQPIFQNGSQF